MAQICIEVSGELEDSVAVKFFTIPGTAEGKDCGHLFKVTLLTVISTAVSDYTPVKDILMIEESGVMCGNISITQTDTAEDTESFSVVLTSLDERVEVKQHWVPVTIIDSDS